MSGGSQPVVSGYRAGRTGRVVPGLVWAGVPGRVVVPGTGAGAGAGAGAAPSPLRVSCSR